MMSTAIHIPAGLGLYFLLHYLQHHQIGPEWVRFYGKDLLFIPLLLALVKESGHLLKKPFPKSEQMAVIAVIYAAIVFELIMPLFQRGHRDFWDVFCYALGAAAYVLASRVNSTNTVHLTKYS